MPKLRVIGVQVEPSVRGDEMRRVTFTAIPTRDCAEGAASLLLTPEAAKKFGLGDEFDLTFRERDGV